MVVFAAVLGANTEIGQGATTNVLGTMSIDRRLQLLKQLVSAAIGRCRIERLHLPIHEQVRYLFVAPEY